MKISDEDLWRLFSIMKEVAENYPKGTALSVGQIFLKTVPTLALDCQIEAKVIGICTAKMHTELGAKNVAVPRTCPTCGLGPCKQGF